MREAEFLFSANPQVKEMFESGDLQKLHSSISTLSAEVQKGLVSVNDQLDRILQTVKDAESDIYETLNSDHGVERSRRHTTASEQSGFEGIFSVASEEKAHENYILARGAAIEAHGDKKDTLEGIVHQLEDLLKSRAAIFEAKVTMLEEHLDKVDCEDLIMQNDLIKMRHLAETFGKAAHRSGSEESVFC